MKQEEKEATTVKSLMLEAEKVGRITVYNRLMNIIEAEISKEEKKFFYYFRPRYAFLLWVGRVILDCWQEESKLRKSGEDDIQEEI
jgi:hypothetical protein